MANNFGKLLTTIPDFEVIEAWDTLFPTALATREALQQEELAPVDLALLTDEDYNALLREKNIVNFSVNAKLGRVRLFVKQLLKEVEQRPHTPESLATAEDQSRDGQDRQVQEEHLPTVENPAQPVEDNARAQTSESPQDSKRGRRAPSPEPQSSRRDSRRERRKTPYRYQR